jgi:hypothetical protein
MIAGTWGYAEPRSGFIPAGYEVHTAGEKGHQLTVVRNSVVFDGMLQHVLARLAQGHTKTPATSLTNQIRAHGPNAIELSGARCFGRASSEGLGAL